jgi:hypothetical protein
MTLRLSPDHPAAASRHTADSVLLGEPRCRDAAWIEVPFLATVRGIDQDGTRFEAETVLDKLSTHGLAMRLARAVRPDTQMLIVIRFATDPARGGAVPGVAAHGVVQQVTPGSDGTYDVAVSFTHHRFLYASVRDR